MLHEIKVQKQDTGVNIEVDVIKKLIREKFFACLQDYNINLEYLSENYKTDLNYVAEFNRFLRLMKKHYHITVCESVLFLEDEGMKQKILLSILSQENEMSLKIELGEKYKLRKENPNTIDQYFE